MCSLDDPGEVAVGGELQALALRPGLDLREAALEAQAPGARAVAQVGPRRGARHHRVERPHVDEVEQLREQLNDEGRVDAAAPQTSHRVRQHFQKLQHKIHINLYSPIDTLSFFRVAFSTF